MYSPDYSVYQKRFEDEQGFYFTEENYPKLKTRTDDVSGILQEAIAQVAETGRYGILYIPEGEYPICHTVKIPPAVRLIGYGKKRPVFVLPKQAKGFPAEIPKDYWEEAEAAYGMEKVFREPYPGAHYMFWFIGEADCRKQNPADANAGTFYSSMSNIDFCIEGTHPTAICVRAHFAQHGFLSHCKFELGDGLAGIFDVGNEMDNLTFLGGQYGIVCRMCSPGWPFVLTDSVFKGQRQAAVLSAMTGFTGVRLNISDTPVGFGSYIEGAWEKLYLEDCKFCNIKKAAIISCGKNRVSQQTNGRNIVCQNVAEFVWDETKQSGLIPERHDYVVEKYVCGYQWTDEKPLGEFTEELTIAEGRRPDEFLPESKCDIPFLPAMDGWRSVRSYGAVGDGTTDDTAAIQNAIDSEQAVYFPQGSYRISDSIVIQKEVSLIGMSPISTQLVISDNTPAFSGFGTAKAILDIAKGVKVIINGLGIDCSGKNPRAAGILWRAGAGSYMNDVKFVGGHGLMYRDGRNAFDTLYNASRTADYDATKEWDYQYPGLWITSDGGGTFKDIWSASPYQEAGIAIDHTVTPGHMYGISLEHHVRSELKMHDVENWRFYGLQTEEEKAEGLECLPLEMVSCKNLLFANFFLFRVVAVDQTYETGIRAWNSTGIEICNLFNKAQMQYTFLLSYKDETAGVYAKSPEYAHIVSGCSTAANANPAAANGNIAGIPAAKEDTFVPLAGGYNFAQGACLDEAGNLYWCDKLKKRIYRYGKESRQVLPLLDIHYKPSALFVRNGYLFVAVDYSELRDKEECNPFAAHDPNNTHPFFAWFYKRSAKVYAVQLSNPYDTMVIPNRMDSRAARGYVHVRPQELDYPGMFEQVAAGAVQNYWHVEGTDFVVEDTIDLARTIRLGSYLPGKSYRVTDDAAHRTVTYATDENGNYKEGHIAAGLGQYGSYEDCGNTVWVVDDALYGFDNGKQKERVTVPADAYAVIGNETDRYLIGRHTIYRWER